MVDIVNFKRLLDIRNNYSNVSVIHFYKTRWYRSTPSLQIKGQQDIRVS